MKKLLLPVFVCLAGVAGADVAVGANETRDVAVASDAALSENVFFSVDAHKLEKGGAGAWTLPAS